MRDAIARGYFPGPRMFVAGAYLTITGGGGAMSGDLAPDIGLPWDLRFGIADGAALTAIRRILATPRFAFRGVHCHVGSQLLDTETHVGVGKVDMD